MNGLDAVRARRLEVASREAATLLARASEESRSKRAAAQMEADGLVRAAESEGEHAADADTRRDWTAARRRARAAVLAAERAAYDQLIATATAATTADPRFPALRGRVAAQARRRLGPGTEVSADGDVIVATRRGRHVRWSAGAVIEELVGLGQVELEDLWR
jgi:hypothetical protein